MAARRASGEDDAGPGGPRRAEASGERRAPCTTPCGDLRLHRVHPAPRGPEARGQSSLRSMAIRQWSPGPQSSSPFRARTVIRLANGSDAKTKSNCLVADAGSTWFVRRVGMSWQPREGPLEDGPWRDASRQAPVAPRTGGRARSPVRRRSRNALPVLASLVSIAPVDVLP
jgi:hypothetical protein